MSVSARLFNCTRCHCQVMICRHCDRGNCYCGDSCAGKARRASRRRSSALYQASRRGRTANAQRQQRFRARQREKVTHQGSAVEEADALLPAEPEKHSVCQSTQKVRCAATIVCHFCQRACDPFLRNRFLRPPNRVRCIRRR